MDEMAELGVVWNTQAAVLPLTGPYLRPMFGERARWILPFRSMLERGVVVSGGSDWGVGPMDPFLGIDAMVNHRSDIHRDSAPFTANERISLMDALRIYTLGGAIAGGEEQDKGSIQPGKLADLVVLDRDVTTLRDDAIGELRVDETYVGGQLVYERAVADWSVGVGSGINDLRRI
jgi:predicted amidohydrolase YtcJ